MIRHVALASVLVLVIFAAGRGGSATVGPTPTTTVAALAATPTPVPTPTPLAVRFYKVTGTNNLGLNIREQPDVTGKVVARACEGAIITTNGNPPLQSGDYRWVQVPGLGWAADAFLTASDGPATSDEATDGTIKLICPKPH